MSWACGLCPKTTFTRVLMSDHLEEHHQCHKGLDADLRVALNASKDYPDSAENTFGYYDHDDRLLAVHIQVSERAADDPMRF